MSTSWRKPLAALPLRRPALVRGTLLAGGALLYLKVWLPVTGLGIPCVFHQATGLYCPGCGMTRAALALLQGEVPQAFRFNPLVFCLVPLFAAYAAASRKGMKRTSMALMGAMLTATVAFGVLRNVPAFDWLAPTKIL